MWYPETEGPLWKLLVIMSVESSLSDWDSKNSVSIRKESVWRLWEWFLSGRHFSFWPDLVWDVRSDSCWKVDDDEKHSAADRNICFNFIYPKTKLRRDLHLVPHLSLALTLYTELRKIGLNDILDYIDYFLLYLFFLYISRVAFATKKLTCLTWLTIDCALFNFIPQRGQGLDLVWCSSLRCL